MEKDKSYKVFLEALATKKRAEFDKLTTKASKHIEAGTKSAIAAGESLLLVRHFLVKVGSKGQFSNFCREYKLVRQTAYNHIRTYQWEKVVPAELKTLLAEAKGTDGTLLQLDLEPSVQTDVIGFALTEDGTAVADNKDDALAKVQKLIAEHATAQAKKVDPIQKAVTTATKAFVEAFKEEMTILSDRADRADIFGKTPEEFARDISNRFSGAVQNAGLQALGALNTKYPALAEKNLGLAIMPVQVIEHPKKLAAAQQ